MAYKGTTGGASISTNSTVARPTTAYSYHFWGKADLDAAQSGSDAFFGALDATTTGFEISFYWANATSTRWKAALHRNSGNAIITAQFVTTPVANTWYSIAATWDGANLKAYLNGTLEATTAVTTLKQTADPFVYGLQAGGSVGNFQNGYLAEMAFWNVALDAAEINALSKRFSPMLVRPASIITYWPLLRSLTQKIGPTLGSSNVAVDIHPAIIYPGSFQKTVQTGDFFTGSGALAAAEATLAGTGTVPDTFSGTGALVAAEATLAGTGTVPEPYTGTGALQAAEATLAGVASVLGGSGALVAAEATLAGNGQFSITPTIESGVAFGSAFTGRSPGRLLSGRVRERLDVLPRS